MPPLHSLRIETPHKKYLDTLFQHGIRDCADLLVKSGLAEVSRQTNIPYKVLLELKKEIEGQYGRKVMTLAERLQQLSPHVRHCPTGCHSVDRFLSGGIRGGDITQVTGSEGCGKSQFCYSIAADQILKGNRVLYIDMDSSFSAERVTAILRNKAGPTARLKSHMDLMHVVQVCKLAELFDLLHKLIDDMRNTESMIHKYSIMILDSVPVFLTPHMTQLDLLGEEEAQFSVFKGLIRALNVLRHANPSLAFLVTNNKLEWFKTMWKNACSVTLLLKEKKPVILSPKAASVSPSPCTGLSEEAAAGGGDVAVSPSRVDVVHQLEIIRSNALTVHSDPCLDVVITDSGFRDHSPTVTGDDTSATRGVKEERKVQ